MDRERFWGQCGVAVVDKVIHLRSVCPYSSCSASRPKPLLSGVYEDLCVHANLKIYSTLKLKEVLQVIAFLL